MTEKELLIFYYDHCGETMRKEVMDLAKFGYDVEKHHMLRAAVQELGVEEVINAVKIIGTRTAREVLTDQRTGK